MIPPHLLVAIGAGIAYLLLKDGKNVDRNNAKNDFHGNRRRSRRKSSGISKQNHRESVTEENPSPKKDESAPPVEPPKETNNELHPKS